MVEPVVSDTVFRKPRQHRNRRIRQEFDFRQKPDIEIFAGPAGQIDRGTGTVGTDEHRVDSASSADSVRNGNGGQGDGQCQHGNRIGYYWDIR